MMNHNDTHAKVTTCRWITTHISTGMFCSTLSDKANSYRNSKTKKYASTCRGVIVNEGLWPWTLDMGVDCSLSAWYRAVPVQCSYMLSTNSPGRRPSEYPLWYVTKASRCHKIACVCPVTNISPLFQNGKIRSTTISKQTKQRKCY
jgi:hypothetical protein